MIKLKDELLETIVGGILDFTVLLPDEKRALADYLNNHNMVAHNIFMDNGKVMVHVCFRDDSKYVYGKRFIPYQVSEVDRDYGLDFEAGLIPGCDRIFVAQTNW